MLKGKWFTLFGHRMDGIQRSNKYDMIIATKRQLKCLRNGCERMSRIRLPWFLNVTCDWATGARIDKYRALRKCEIARRERDPKVEETIEGLFILF